MRAQLRFQDAQDIADLEQFCKRALRLDAEGLVRLRVFGDVLAAYVSPIFSGNLLGDGPTVLGLRTMKLAAATELDAIVPLADMVEEFAAATPDSRLSVPSVRSRAAWTGITPPRTNWLKIGELNEAEITAWAKAGIDEVANTLPGAIGSAIAAKVRLEVWGRSVHLEYRLPAACAFAAAGLGFLARDEIVSVYQTNGWVRLTSQNGHVLSRESTRLS